MAISYNLAQDVLKNGKLYYPAKSHYPQIATPNVVCDYCRKQGLSGSIGYLNYDLCFQCVDRLSEKPLGYDRLPDPYGPQGPVTFMNSPCNNKKLSGAVSRMFDIRKLTSASITEMRQDLTTADPLKNPNILIGMQYSVAVKKYPHTIIRPINVGTSLTEEFCTSRINVTVYNNIISSIEGIY